MFVQIESDWMKRIQKRVWNHCNFGRWICCIRNDQYRGNQSLEFHLSQTAIDCKIYNRPE